MKRFKSFGIVPGLIVLILLILPCYSESAEIALVMSSDSGDYVGQGQSYFYSIEDGSFTSNTRISTK